MKYFLSFFCTLFLVVIVLLGNTSNQDNNSEFLRIHIRANSNLQIDQNIKYEVKDAIVDAMIPLLSTCTTKNQSIQTINQNLDFIEQTANHILVNNGFNYSCTAKINNENFPTRTYGSLILESGFYDALILELGSGNGDNWWCVVYPPLCFINGSSEVSGFKSRILEIIDSFI